jgi:AcrR family transcriptional regulator
LSSEIQCFIIDIISSIYNSGEGEKMGFQRARTNEHVQERIREIISAASKIYDTAGYEGLSFSAISELTKFTRPAIYKYFNTKDEILLKILIQDLEEWKDQLVNSFVINKIYTINEIADIWVTTISMNNRLLKLYSILFTTIEKNVSLEALADFKKELFRLQVPMVELLSQLFPNTNEDEISCFIINQLAMAQGLYPMSEYCEIQLKALEKSGYKFEIPDFKASYKTIIYQLMYCLEKGIQYSDNKAL